MASSYWNNSSVLQTLDLQQTLSVFGDLPDYDFSAISATIHVFFHIFHYSFVILFLKQNAHIQFVAFPYFLFLLFFSLSRQLK